MSILINETGFSVGGRAVPWSAVRTIATFKRDFVTYDDIRLAFETAPDAWVEVSEEEPGFPSLMAEVGRRYPGVPPDWYFTVMFPAFATSYRVLWSRA